MKTLDEVIKANECCDHGEPDSRCEDCPYNGIGACALERETDALHYLKKYREEDKKLGAAINEACDVEMKYCRLVEELERNEPLTWEQLKQMEGKPVWVVCLESGFREWNLIHAILDDQIWFADGNGTIWNNLKSSMGAQWQAYRKERE